ncbi:MAG: 4Fe-4S cluster-binding domain-containing protein [Lachnospiraceae bacterium]|nr:4Fe-4S cluster-binding domain-containing protein [Lachnospiraceae bacterium]
MNNKHNFNEVISKYLQNLMCNTEKRYGKESSEYKALYYQYVKTDAELMEMREHNDKHYEAIVDCEQKGLRYIERLYKRQATIDLTTACSAHCRYCLRQNYESISLNQEDENAIMEYLAKDEYLKEILITGGDPLLVVDKLIHVMERIINEAPNIRIIRIGTRVPVQNPEQLDKKLLEFFNNNNKKVFFEIALQINHKIELQSETQRCIRELQRVGVCIYAQNVLLKNVNSSMETLIELYDALRYEHIETHYLFHPVPISRTAQFRMPLDEFLNFARLLTSSGEIPGRSKPMFSLMTDIGKCTLYEGTLRKTNVKEYVDVKTAYRLEERLKWNPQYKLPASARIADDGTLIVRYMDGI